jgi:glycosyltransferase involved in cell wall biosynthesis
LKILQIIDTLAIGGAEKVLVTLANIQHRKGDEVTVMTLLQPGALAAQLDQDIPVVSLLRGWKFNPITMYRFVSIARNYDIIHVHSSHNLRYVFLSSILWGLKKPIVFHEHFGNIEIDTSIQWHQKWIMPQVTLIGVSQQICDWAVHKIGIPKSQVHLLHNVVKEMPFQSSNQSRDNITSILVCSNIRRPKHIEFAIEVFAAYLQQHPAQLTIIGQAADTEYFAEIKQLILHKNLANNIRFVHDCTEIQPVLDQFDIALHTPVSESGPLVLIEYLAQGLPFVSYKTGEIARMVETAFPECILSSFQVEEWVQAMQSLLQIERQELGRSMRHYYESNFSEESYYEKCQAIYRSALIS